MASITPINSGDLISDSREDINNNFTNLNNDKIETSVLDTDTALTANSDTKIATQKAVKAYVDSGGQQNASETVRGLVEEATDAEVTAGTDTGGTGAKLFVPPSKMNTRIVALSKSQKIYISTTEVTFTDGNGGAGAGSEQTCFSTTIAGGSLGTNNGVKFKMYIRGGNINAGASAWTIRVKFGGTTYISLVSAVPNNNQTNLHGYLEGYILADGATNAQKITASCFLAEMNEDETATDASIVMDKSNFNTSVQAGNKDSTADQTLEISVQMTNSANNDGVMEWFIAELIK